MKKAKWDNDLGAHDFGFDSVNDMNERVNEAVAHLGFQFYISYKHPKSGRWIIDIAKLEEKQNEAETI